MAWIIGKVSDEEFDALTRAGYNRHADSGRRISADVLPARANDRRTPMNATAARGHLEFIQSELDAILAGSGTMNNPAPFPARTSPTGRVCPTRRPAIDCGDAQKEG